MLFANFLELFLESAPWLLLGLVLAGMLKMFVPMRWMQKQLGGHGVKATVKAAIIGAPLPLCSCGVIPAAIGLRRSGASKAATTSFLVSTPETGVDSITVSYVLLGPFMAIVRPIAAVISAITAGLLVGRDDVEESKSNADTSLAINAAANDSVMKIKPMVQDASLMSIPTSSSKVASSSCCSSQAKEKKEAKATSSSCCSSQAEEKIEVKAASSSCCSSQAEEKKEAKVAVSSCCSSKPAAKESSSCCSSEASSASNSCSATQDIASELKGTSVLGRLGKGLHYAATDLVRDTAIWLLIGLFFAALVQTYVPADFLAKWGDGIFAMLVMVLISVPMYICATASTPIAAGLLLAGVSPGAVLVFMLAGPASNIATLGVVAKELGKRALLGYLGGVLGVALLSGILVNYLVATFGFEVMPQIGEHHELLPDSIVHISGFILAVLMAKVIFEKIPRSWWRRDCCS